MSRSTALLLLNLQNASCHSKGSLHPASLPPPDLQHVLANCRSLHAASRGRGITTFFSFLQYAPDYADAGLLVHRHPSLRAKRALVAGSWDAALSPDAPSPSPTDLLLPTPRFDPFLHTPLDHLLSSHGIHHLVIAGLFTDTAVESAARAAFDRDYRVTIIEDATCAASPDAKTASLAALSRHFARLLPAATPAHTLFQAP